MNLPRYRLFPRFSRRAFLHGSAAAAISLTAGAGRGRAAEENRVNVYNWDTYIGETTLDTFKKATGISVQYDLFADNEELFAKLKVGNPGYDIIVPSDYMVEDMITVGMLQRLDHSRIPNIKHLDPAFTNPAYDPGMKYSIPYMWGVIGLGYRKSSVDSVPDSWGDVFEPERARKYSGRIAFLGDMRAVMGCALKYLGYGMNSIDPKEIARARDLLIAAKPYIKTFADDNGQDLLMSREVDIAIEWSGDIAAVMLEDDDLSFVVPKEGANLFIDNICIPAGAPHPGNAHAFINHLHDIDAHIEILNTTQFATTNISARKRMPAEYTGNPAIFPTAEALARSEPLFSVGEHTRLYDEAWTALRAS